MTGTVVENACVVVAMREMLDDPEWAPPFVVAMIRVFEGYPSNLNPLLERYAPVRVFTECDIDFNPRELRIKAGEERVTLADGDRALVLYKTDPGRGHCECLDVPAMVRATSTVDAAQSPARPMTQNLRATGARFARECRSAQILRRHPAGPILSGVGLSERPRRPFATRRPCKGAPGAAAHHQEAA